MQHRTLVAANVTCPGAVAEDISVLLPVYLPHASADAVDKLRRAVRSVTQERYPGRMELVVVDDGSPVAVAGHLDPAAVLPPHALRIIRLARNRGIAQALNKGLEAARHPLIARIDADDAWLPGKIAAQIACLRASPGVTIVGTGMWFVPEWGDLPAPGMRWRGGWSDALRFCEHRGSPFPGASILARRDVYRLLGGYPDGRRTMHAEDYALWSLWLRFFRPHMCEGIHYHYTASPGSITGRHWARQQKASEGIRAALRRLDLADVVPSAMAEVASLLGLSELQAGVLAWRLWRERPVFACPPAAIGALRRLLPDRSIGAPLMPQLRRPRSIPDLLEGFGAPATRVGTAECAVWSVRGS